MSETQVWRAVLENGETREIVVRSLPRGGWTDDEYGSLDGFKDFCRGDTPRIAALHGASMRIWPVVEILAPMQSSRAEIDGDVAELRETVGRLRIELEAATPLNQSLDDHDRTVTALRDGAARELVVWRDDNGWTTGIEGYAPTARLAVARSATGCCACPVREILAPGERSRAEIIESVLATIDKQEVAMLLASKSACESRQPAFHAAANAYAHAAAIVRKETDR